MFTHYHAIGHCEPLHELVISDSLIIRDSRMAMAEKFGVDPSVDLVGGFNPSEKY